MFKSREKPCSTLPARDGREGRMDPDGDGEVREAEDLSPRSDEDFDPDPVAQFRWIPWVLAFLVLVCILLAVWVWFELLHA